MSYLNSLGNSGSHGFSLSMFSGYLDGKARIFQSAVEFIQENIWNFELTKNLEEKKKWVNNE